MSGGIIRRVVAAIAALFMAATFASPAAAGVGTALKTCYRPVQSHDRAAAILIHPSGFDCARPQRLGRFGDFWVLSAPLPALGDDDLAVRSASTWQRSSTLHVLYADGSIRTIGYDSATTWRHMRLGATVELPLPRAAARPVRLLWLVRGAANLRGVVIDPRLATAEQSHAADLPLAAFYAGFGGLGVALLALNIALAAALRQRFHPPYCAMVVILLLYVASASGVMAQLTGIDNNLRMRLNVLLMAGSVSSAMIFARRFLSQSVVSGWIDRGIKIALACLLVSSAAFALAMPWHAYILDRMVAVSFAMTVALAVPLLWRGWQSRDSYARAFTIAWGLPLLTAGARIAQAMGAIEWNFWIDNSTLIAMALEAAGSGVAIAWRIKQLGEERDLAREQEMLARLLADSDPLTGLLNRRSFLREAIGREGRQLLVLVDIDHFKQVNDTLGHDGGDQVLRVFADALRAAVPADALVARIGGEEFAVLAPDAAIDLPDTILARIRGSTMPYDLNVTASLGSECGEIASESEWKTLYRNADAALYAAKRAGRDRVRWAAAA